MTKKQPKTIDIRGKMILLGTGTSTGVPALGCGCEVCSSGHPRNQRTRCSAILGLPHGNLLIDTSPDMRAQLLREKIGIAHSVIYTHEHADHIFGLDDLRLFQFYLGHPVPLYCNEVVEKRLRHSYDYAFTKNEQTHAGAVPSLTIHRIGDQPIDILGARVIPVPLLHGPRFNVLGFRFGDIAYCTDVKSIPEASMERLRGLRVLILGALRPRLHPTHMNFEEAIEIIDRLKPQRTFFTHCSCDVDYESANESLPENVEIAYDGLQVDL
jgi:phosphoribosyl 1,2-cyclic phosphate phosphodiesterase